MHCCSQCSTMPTLSSCQEADGLASQLSDSADDCDLLVGTTCRTRHMQHCCIMMTSAMPEAPLRIHWSMPAYWPHTSFMARLGLSTATSMTV